MRGAPCQHELLVLLGKVGPRTAGSPRAATPPVDRRAMTADQTVPTDGPATRRLVVRRPVFFLWALAACTVIGAGGPRPAGATPLRGVALPLFSADAAHDYLAELREIRQLGATAVSIVVLLHQDGVEDTVVHDPRGTVAWRRLPQVLRAAKAEGLRVLVMPILHLQDAGPGKWRGRLTPRSWGAWFESYTTALLHYADAAQAARVDVFSVGSELISSERHVDEWIALIARVRSRFAGALLYSSNWDRPTERPFVTDLDYLATNAYHRLSRSRTPTVAELTRSWRRVQARMQKWHERYGKPIVITEVGYRSADGSIRRPWDYVTPRPLDLGEQEHGYRAFVEAWTGIAFLEGAFFYAWTGPGGPADPSYTPRGKPAEHTLREWLQGRDSAAVAGASASEGRLK